MGEQCSPAKQSHFSKNEYIIIAVNIKKMKKFQKKLATLCKVWYTKDVGKLIKSS